MQLTEEDIKRKLEEALLAAGPVSDGYAEIELTDGKLGILTNRFGFTVKGVPYQPISILASTNLAGTNWTVVRNTVLGSTPFYFSDPSWTGYQRRFYRVRGEF